MTVRKDLSARETMGRPSLQYAGQKYRVMFDIHHFDGTTEPAIFGWTDEIDHEWLRRSSNGDAAWSNLRHEAVSLAQRIMALPEPEKIG